MKISIAVLAIVITVAIASSAELFKTEFDTEGTAVLGQKQKGGGVAILLPSDVSSPQQRVLQQAYDIAKKDGHKDPELLQAIVFQESRAGGMASYRVAGQEYGLKPLERYYGVGQIKLQTARGVLNNNPELRKKYLQGDTDEELAAQLMLNDEFNMHIASKLLLELAKCGDKAAAYNQGCAGMVTHKDLADKYSNSVSGFMSKFKATHAPKQSKITKVAQVEKHDQKI